MLIIFEYNIGSFIAFITKYKKKYFFLNSGFRLKVVVMKFYYYKIIAKASRDISLKIRIMLKKCKNRDDRANLLYNITYFSKYLTMI